MRTFSKILRALGRVFAWPAWGYRIPPPFPPWYIYGPWSHWYRFPTRSAR